MTFTASIEETGVSRNITSKKKAQYCSTKINDKTVLETLKNRPDEITGVNLSSLARSVRSCMGVHPANTHKIEEILARLVKRSIVIHRDAIVHIATPEERAAAAQRSLDGDRKRKQSKMMTRRRVLPKWSGLSA